MAARSMVARRFYGLLLYCYPRDFRRNYGGAMAQLFADQLRDCTGAVAVVRQWFVTLADVFRNGLAERWLLLRGEAQEVRAIVRQPGGSVQPGDPWWRRSARDWAFAWRRIWQRPVFAAVAVVTLAVGIGANTAMFSVVNGTLLRPLPYPESDRLVFLTEDTGISVPDAVDWRAASKTLSHIASATFRWDLDLTGHGEAPERIAATLAESQYWDVFGVAPMIGRTFTSEEDRPGGPWVAVLSEGFWRSHFGADSGVVGRTIILSDNPAEIIGVMPASFTLLEDDIDLWAPISVVTPWAPETRGSNHLHALGRMAPGATLAEVQAEMESITLALEEEHPRVNAGKISHPTLLQDALVDSQRTALLVLLAAVGLVLLIACVNLATLLLVRAASDQDEIAVRLALGASRATVVKQAIRESLTLAALGAVFGLGLAVVGLDALLSLAPESMVRLGEVDIDPAVLGFSALVTIGTTLVFGVLPGWWVSGTDPSSVIHGGGGRVARGHQRTHSTLVATEVALAFVLLLGAGLMVRTMQQLDNVDLGFDTAVVTADLSLPDSRYGADHVDRQTEAFTTIVERLNQTPGIEIAASVIGVPLGGQHVGNALVFEGRDPVAPGEEPGARNRPVVGNYFRAMGVPIVRGRAFGPEDTPDGELVAIINEQLAREFWPDSDPIGQRIAWTDGTPLRWMRIIGVAKDTKFWNVRDPDFRAVYTLYSQRRAVWQRFGSFVVRSRLPLGTLQQTIQEVVSSYDASLPVANVVTMAYRRNLSVSRERFLTTLLTVFAGVALIVSVQGLYGILAFSVAQRRREIGIRAAMGATGSKLIGTVVGRAARLAAIGLVLGVAVGALSSKLLDSLLFGIATRDLATYAVAGGVVSLVTLVASLLPAWSAAQTNPVEVLRGS